MVQLPTYGKLSERLTKASNTSNASDPRSSAASLLGIIGRLPDVVFQCEKRADGKIYWTLNEGRLAQEFHLTTDEVRDKPLEALFPPPVVEHLLPEFEAAFRGEARDFTNELGGRYFRHFPQPVFGPDGKVTCVVGFITEVTKLVLAEKQITMLNEKLGHQMDDLATANRDLEAFAYSVSHDLRTPLTAVDLYAQLILREDSGSLSTPGRTHLEKMRASLRQMTTMIEDILRLSRSATTPLNQSEVDLGAMARSISKDLHMQDAHRNVQWSIMAPLRANCDPTLIRVVLENLLGNAWKYSGKNQAARIEFGARPQGIETVYYVRDDGAGFDMKASGALFQAFSRLHAATEFEGTGVGLATVKRIIQRHGGRVWAEGAVGKGATFCFTLGSR